MQQPGEDYDASRGEHSVSSRHDVGNAHLLYAYVRGGSKAQGGQRGMWICLIAMMKH